MSQKLTQKARNYLFRNVVPHNSVRQRSKERMRLWKASTPGVKNCLHSFGVSRYASLVRAIFPSNCAKLRFSAGFETCSSRSRVCSHSRGYTLAEILIVVGIIGFLTAVVVARYRDFDSTTVLKNLAYEIALSVREAQVMTISSSNLGGGGGAIQTEGQNSYGINFNENSSSYTIFNDLNENDTYNSATELVKLVTITQGAQITSLAEYRAGTATEYPISDATITFDRPHLDTTFVTSSGSNNVVEVVLTVTSNRGGVRLVHIARSGRISVE